MRSRRMWRRSSSASKWVKMYSALKNLIFLIASLFTFYIVCELTEGVGVVENT